MSELFPSRFPIHDGDILEIAGISYKIRAGTDIDRQLARDGDAGQCCYRAGEIRLCTDTEGTDRLRKTVLHELIHAVNYEYQRDSGLTEGEVDRLAQGLAQVFKQLGIVFVIEVAPG